MATNKDKIRLPKKGEKAIRNPFAAYYEAMPKIAIDQRIAAYYQKIAKKIGCDLTTMINDVLEERMIHEKRDVRKLKK